MNATAAFLPVVQSASWRALQAADAAAWLALAHVCAEADHGPLPGATPPWRDLPPAQTLGLFGTAGTLLAAAWLTLDTSMQHEYRVFLTLLVHPEQREQGLEAALLGWLEAQAQLLLAPLPAERPAVLRLDFEHHNTAVGNLYAAHGYTCAMIEDQLRRTLVASLPTEAWPLDMAMEPWTAARSAAFFAVYAAAFRERPGFPGWPEQVWVQNMTGFDEFRPDLSLLVLHAEQPVAYALCAVEAAEPEVGFVVQMGVHPQWRKRGLGGAVLSTLLQRFTQAGLTTAALDVNANNPTARSVYERLGFMQHSRYTSYRKQVQAGQ